MYELAVFDLVASVYGREEEEEVFITSGNWRGKHNSLSRGASAGPMQTQGPTTIYGQKRQWATTGPP